MNDRKGIEIRLGDSVRVHAWRFSGGDAMGEVLSLREGLALIRFRDRRASSRGAPHWVAADSLTVLQRERVRL